MNKLLKTKTKGRKSRICKERGDIRKTLLNKCHKLSKKNLQEIEDLELDCVPSDIMSYNFSKLAIEAFDKDIRAIIEEKMLTLVEKSQVLNKVRELLDVYQAEATKL